MREGWVIVTGASRGIGAAIAADLAGRSLKVAALSRSGEAPAGTGFRCDVTNPDAVALVMDEIAKSGPVIGLVNNAGQQKSHSIMSMTVADYEAIMRLDATAVLTTSQLVYPHLVASDGGTIVNIGSFYDKLGVKNNLAYCAAKAAVGAMTRCMAVEWAKDGIRVVNVAPGYVETDLNRDYLNNEKYKPRLLDRIPVKRPAQPSEVARLVGMIIAENIGALTGETIYMDGAQAIYSI